MAHNFEADGSAAYFARLNENNAIDQVFVVMRSEMLDSDGIEQEALGIAICKESFGGDNWLRVSNQSEHQGGMPGYWWVYDLATNTFTQPAEPIIAEPVAEATE